MTTERKLSEDLRIWRRTTPGIALMDKFAARAEELENTLGEALELLQNIQADIQEIVDNE